MNKNTSRFNRLGLKLALFVLLGLPELAGAQFLYTSYGDVLAGFRRSPFQGGNEVVSDLGNVTNFLLLSPGKTISITNFSPAQLTTAFANYNNLQWSAFATFPPGNITYKWPTPLGNYPNDTTWLTLPGTNVTTQTTPPARQSQVSQANQVNRIIGGVGGGAGSISGFSAESVNNTNTEVEESETYTQYDLTAAIGDSITLSDGDFASDGPGLSYTVENTTPASFTGTQSQRSDFYQLVPSGQTDPINLSTTTTYFVGDFILNANGTMNFTRAFTVTPSVNSGSPPLKVVFSDTATSSSITNWVWNFGNGTIITNTTSANVTNTYAAAGSYTVTLTVYSSGGFGGVSTSVVVTSSAQPQLSIAASAGQFVISGTNGPASQQYRILTATNLLTQVSNWTPIYTNTVAGNSTFFYTNTIGMTNSFFIMVSP